MIGIGGRLITILPHQDTGELALVRMALDTIVQAVERRAIETERARLESRLRQARRMEKRSAPCD
jgi:hypothetical protein